MKKLSLFLIVFLIALSTSPISGPNGWNSLWKNMQPTREVDLRAARQTCFTNRGHLV